MKALLNQYYGFIFEPALIDEIAEAATYQKVRSGQTLMDFGQFIISMPLLISGSIKILRQDKSGKEIFLYYLERGDTCAMTLNCCMGDKRSEIRAIAETDAEVIMIPVRYMDQWLIQYRSWRNFVFESYNLRFDELLETIDSIAFMKMDERLWKHLTDKAKVTGSMVISQTHQDIAYELNTSRVVVSRLLKQLEHNELIQLHRNKIELKSLTRT